MVTQIKSWGNGQGIHLSKELLKELDMHVDDYLQLKVQDGDIILSKTFKHKTLEERAAEYGGKLGPYEELSWGDITGREEW